MRRAAEACRPGTLITDAGSTKAAIVAESGSSLPAGARFVGSHPLAGSEKSGPAAAVADLFVDRTVVVTPHQAPRADDRRRSDEFWKSLGAKVVTMTADEHDRVARDQPFAPSGGFGPGGLRPRARRPGWWLAAGSIRRVLPPAIRACGSRSCR